MSQYYYLVESENWKKEEADIVTELPVSLTVNGEYWLTFMCTPTYPEALAVGFLYNEGMIDVMNEVADVRVCTSGDNVDVWLYHAVEKPANWRRASGCTGGLTAATQATPDKLLPTTNDIVLSISQVGALIEQLFESQDLYRKSGGIHTSAISDGDKICVVTEDIGQHNTLDKIAGRCLIENIYPSRCILLTTGRVSSEMMQKADRLGASVVISRTSPSSLSLQIAEERGITMIGYARRQRFRLYTHPERILLPEHARMLP